MTPAALTDALASVHDAGAVRTPPWMAVVTALATARPEGIGGVVDWLTTHRAELEAAYDAGRGGTLGLAVLPPEMVYTPDLGGLDRPRNDHTLREKYLFADIVGKQGFFQAAVYAMTGLEITSDDAVMLDTFGTINLLIDRKVWPLAATRRVAARGGGYAAAVLAGTAMMGSTVLAGGAAGECARFLRGAREAELAGVPVDDHIAALLARRERIMGFGRPVVGPDERVPLIEALLARHGRHDLPYVTILRAADRSLLARKNLGSTAAAWAAAILSDYGMSPDAVLAVSNYWVNVNVYAQALYSSERGLGGGS